MYIATSQSCNGISGEPSSSSPPVNLRSGALRGGRKVTKEPAYAFILPNLEQYPADFRHFLERDIIEISTLRRLENSGHLNWWCQHDSNQRLWPLVTTGDGNCLLHAASLGIWGVHDRQLNWRNTLHDVLKFGSRKHAIYRRWRWHESKNNLASGLVLSEEEWRREWNAVLELASPTPRPNPSDNNYDAPATSSSSGPAADNEQNGKEGTPTAQQQQQDQVYESLECVHVFALAHILHRPIIVVADTILRNAKGEELAPIPFGGIYLPLECPPEQCHRSPLLLCFDQSHFSALVAMRQSISTTLQVIPITDKNRNLLPVHFSVDPGPDFTWWRDNDDFRIAHKIEAIQSDDRRLELISRYMDIVRLDLRRGSVRKTVPMPLLAAMNGAGANFEDGTLRSNGGGGLDAVACSSYMLPPVPNKLLTLAAGGVPSSSASDCAAAARAGSSSSGSSASSSILKEIRQHFRRLGRKLSLLSSRRHTQQQYHQPRCSLPTAMEEETQQQHNQQQQQRMMKRDEVDGWTTSAKAEQHHQQQQYNNNNCGINSTNHHHQYQQNGTNNSSCGSYNKKGHHRSHSTTPFAAAELLQDNHVVLTVLLHNYAHQYIDSMLTLYIAKAKERFERAKMMPHSALPPLPKNRLSRSFSTASVLLTCLSAHCQRVAQPSNNFLCDACFAAQKRELTRTLIGGSGAANAALAAASSAANISATTTNGGGGGSGNNKGTAIILIRANDDDDDEQKRSGARKNNATKNDSNISTTTTTNSHRSHCDISTIC